MSTEGTGPAPTCCVCEKRPPIACGVCLGVSAIVDDVDWWCRMLERAHTAAHELRAELDTVRAELARARERFHEASTMGWHDNGRGGLYRVTELVTVAGQSDEDRAEHLAHLRGER